MTNKIAISTALFAAVSCNNNNDAFLEETKPINMEFSD